MASRVIVFFKAEVPVDSCLQFSQLEKNPRFLPENVDVFLN